MSVGCSSWYIVWCICQSRLYVKATFRFTQTKWKTKEISSHYRHSGVLKTPFGAKAFFHNSREKKKQTIKRRQKNIQSQNDL